MAQKVDATDFEQMMLAVSKHDVDMATYLTPVNFEAAKKEFLTNPKLRYPNFEYPNCDFKEKFKRLSSLRRDYQVYACLLNTSDSADD